MAAFSATDYNLETTADNSTSKKKCPRTRSKAYRKRRSARRKQQSFYKSKRLQRFLNHKTKKLQMSSSVKQTLDLSNFVVQTTPRRCRKENEIAYWKSRATSLQYENQMLYKHIEEIYTNMITLKTNTSNTNQDYEEINDTNYEDIEDLEDDTNFNEEGRLFRLQRDKERQRAENNKVEEISSQPPVKQSSKEREEEMKKLYGSSWRAIMGMETVVQLNYDITLDKQKINYWPILPIKM